MTSPRTGTIGIQRPAPVGPARSRSRAVVHAVTQAVVRTPEVTIGALGVVVAAAFSWVPALWYDEVATVVSARRSLPELWAEVHNVDAVHGLYYALMHCWFWLVGYSPFTLRFPSALAIGVAAGLVVALGRRLGGLRLGVVSGIVFLVLPRVAWAGGEGRPYATVAMIAVGSTVLGLAAVRRSRSGPAARWWIAYAVVVAVGVVFNVYLALVVLAHGVALAWTALAGRRGAAQDTAAASLVRTPDGSGAHPLLVTRGVLVRWAVAVAVAAVVVSPFVLAAARQTKQVGWIQGIGADTVRQVFQTAWFGGQTVYAAVAWALMAFAVVAVTIAARRARPGTRDAFRAQTLRVALPIALLPMTVLVLVTAAGAHLWTPKYATMSLPFVAVLMGLALTAIRPRRWLAVAVTVVVLGSVPTSVATRTEYAKQDSHWADVAALVEAQRTGLHDADEGVVYGSVWRHPNATSQAIAAAYPKAFAGLTDLGVSRTGAQRAQLWDENGDIATTVPRRLDDIDTVWYLGGKSRSIRAEVTATLEQHGFVQDQHWMVGQTVIGRYDRVR